MSQLKQVLSTMTTREKLDHIWTYYKLHICAILLAVILVISWGVSIYNNSKEVLISGNILNVFLSEDGQRYLTEDSFAAVGGRHNRQTVNISSRFISQDEAGTTGYLQLISIMASIEGQDLDFLILDEALFQEYALSDFYMELQDFFTDEEMEQWADQIAYVDSEYLGKTYPAGIRLNDTAFARQCMADDTNYYLVFVATTPRLSACRAFWNHILNYGT